MIFVYLIAGFVAAAAVHVVVDALRND